MRKFLNFEVVREQWGEIELPGDLRIRARIVLLRTWEDENGQGQIQTTTELAVLAPEDLRGKGGKGSVQDAKPKRDFARGEWKIRRLPESTYVVDGKFHLTVSLRPEEIVLLDQFDATGDPLLRLGWNGEVVSTPLQAASAQG